MDTVSGRDTGEKERERGRDGAGIRRERGEESERLSKKSLCFISHRQRWGKKARNVCKRMVKSRTLGYRAKRFDQLRKGALHTIAGKVRSTVTADAPGPVHSDEVGYDHILAAIPWRGGRGGLLAFQTQHFVAFA